MSTSVDRRAFLALGAGALGVAVAPGFLKPRERLVRLSVPVMGTVGELAVPARHEGMARQALGAAAAELRRIESLMTRFRDDSDVGRFNRLEEDARLVVSPETSEVVRQALRWSVRTRGRFDPTLGRLTELWDPVRTDAPPDEAEIHGAQGGVAGWARLALKQGRAGSSELVAATPGTGAPVKLDLGGIAKGYGVDQAARVLREHGVYRGLVNVGGDLVALGTGPEGRPWRIGIRDPRDPDGIAETLEVEDAAVATSGDYLRYFEHRGRRYHHILDPATGRPVASRVRSVTVVAREAIHADAAATVAFAGGVGPDEGFWDGAPGHPRVAHRI